LSFEFLLVLPVRFFQVHWGCVCATMETEQVLSSSVASMTEDILQQNVLDSAIWAWLQGRPGSLYDQYFLNSFCIHFSENIDRDRKMKKNWPLNRDWKMKKNRALNKRREEYE
jgi:hypothetical protein